MPYMPPDQQQSPASTKSNSPAPSRSNSYSGESPRLPTPQRPQPPRSMSSASYLHRHRRSPSITKQEHAPPTPTDVIDFATIGEPSVAFSNINGSIRQSPPPVNNLVIPTGAIISPPDSSENSDGDENAAAVARGRDLTKNWNELQEAVRSIDLRREGSPAKEAGTKSCSEPVSQVISPTALTPEARKISHSRSSTETAIVIPNRPHFTESPTAGSDDSDEDDGPLSKPSLVRKKSGELVKPALRPSSRRRYSSMPGTPTYSKSVHFNDTSNQTRHFLQVDKPTAVSAASSPVETYESEPEYPFEGSQSPKVEWEIKLANFPEDTLERKSRPVRVERIFLGADNKTLIGSVACANLSFHKLVVARFTLDYWKTTSEVVADFSNDVRQPLYDGFDRFKFNIKLSDQANIETKTLLLCVRYNVNGQEHWDNNDNTNFQIDFVKNVKNAAHSTMNTGLGVRPLNAIPRSRHSPPTTSHGRPPSVDDDLVARFDTGSAYSFGSPRQIIGESPTSVKLKSRAKRGSIFPGAASSQAPANGLGGRYDFGASLSAALGTAQDRLGKNGGPMANPAFKTESGYFTKDHKNVFSKPTETPAALTTDRPALGSDQYRELVQKFCYFTSGSGSSKSPTSPQTGEHAAKALDGAVDEESVSDGVHSTTSTDTSSSTTVSPDMEILHERGNGTSSASSLSPFLSQSGSPASATGGLGRVLSPVTFGYPYHSSMRDGYLSESPTPTATYG